MKTNIVCAAVLATSLSALALPIADFTSWDDIIGRSPDIIIAKCIATQDMLPQKPTILFGNVCNSDIEVMSVLKGDTTTGSSHLLSSYNPYRGEIFIAFGSYSTYGTNGAYCATEDYRVVPLRRLFTTNVLSGKTVKEQVQLILASRLNDLNEEMERDNVEKQRIDAELGIVGGTNAAVSTPPKNPESLPPHGGGSF